MRQLCLLLALGCAFAAEVHAETPFMRNEVVAAFGRGASPEKSVLNVTTDNEVGSGLFSTYFKYLYNVRRDFAFGFHLYGYRKKDLEYSVDFQDGNPPAQLRLLLEVFNIGGQLRYTFMPQRRFRPYVVGLLSFVSGGVESDLTGRLTVAGHSYGGGIGLSWAVAKNVHITGEILGSTGSANFKQVPFENSRDDRFNPGYYGGFIGLTLLFEEVGKEEDESGPEERRGN